MIKLTPSRADRVIYLLMIVFLIGLAVALKTEPQNESSCVDRSELISAGIYSLPNVEYCKQD